MKKVLSVIVLFTFMFLLVGCGSMTQDEVMASHLEKGPSISLDESMYTYSSTLDASFVSITNLDATIISVYVYEYNEYDPMGTGPGYTYAYVIVEDKYAVKNGASLAVDNSKYITLFSSEETTTPSNEILLVQNASTIFNGHRVPEGLEVPSFDLLETLSSINLT